MNSPKLLYHREAKKFIKMVKTGEIFTITTEEPNYTGEKNLRFYMSIEGKAIHDCECWDMFGCHDTFTRVWKLKQLNKNRVLLYRSNGVCVRFFTHESGCEGHGDLHYGQCITKNIVFTVIGGQKITASILRKHTNMEVVGVFIDDNICYIHKEIAEAIAAIVGLKVGESEHFGNPKENEIVYAFTEA